MTASRNTKHEKWAQEIEASFLKTYEENSDAIFRHCAIRIRDREIARDIAQETFSRAWLYISSGKEVKYMKAFLYRIANNLIVDTVRKKKSSSLDAMIDDDGFEPADDSLVHPGEASDTREAMKLLDSLDELYRTVITMRYMDEMSPKEIARILGVSENVVSVRIHRGIEKLGKLMENHQRSMEL